MRRARTSGLGGRGGAACEAAGWEEGESERLSSGASRMLVAWREEFKGGAWVWYAWEEVEGGGGRKGWSMGERGGLAYECEGR